MFGQYNLSLEPNTPQKGRNIFFSTVVTGTSFIGLLMYYPFDLLLSLSNLLESIIRKFILNLIFIMHPYQAFEVLKTGNQYLNQYINNSIIIIGESGVGKTTLAKYLTHQQLHVVQDKVDDCVFVTKNSNGQIEQNSHTIIPKVYQTETSEQGSISVVDFIGSHHRYGTAGILFREFFKKKLFSVTQQYRLIFTIQYMDLETSSQYLRQAFISFYDIFQNWDQILEVIVKATCILVTKVPKPITVDKINKKLKALQPFQQDTKISECFSAFRSHWVNQRTIFKFEGPYQNQNTNTNNNLLEQILKQTFPFKNEINSYGIYHLKYISNNPNLQNFRCRSLEDIQNYAEQKQCIQKYIEKRFKMHNEQICHIFTLIIKQCLNQKPHGFFLTCFKNFSASQSQQQQSKTQELVGSAYIIQKHSKPFLCEAQSIEMILNPKYPLWVKKTEFLNRFYKQAHQLCQINDLELTLNSIQSLFKLLEWAKYLYNNDINLSQWTNNLYNSFEIIYLLYSTKIGQQASLYFQLIFHVRNIIMGSFEYDILIYKIQIIKSVNLSDPQIFGRSHQFYEIYKLISNTKKQLQQKWGNDDWRVSCLSQEQYQKSVDILETQETQLNLRKFILIIKQIKKQNTTNTPISAIIEPLLPDILKVITNFCNHDKLVIKECVAQLLDRVSNISPNLKQEIAKKYSTLKKKV